MLGFSKIVVVMDIKFDILLNFEEVKLKNAKNLFL
jgi:hypothetical protein